MCCKNGNSLYVNPLRHPSKDRCLNNVRSILLPIFEVQRVRNPSCCYLTIWSVACSCNHFMEVGPVNNKTFWYTPYADLGIKRTADEVPFIYGIELDTCNCPTKIEK